MSNLPPIALATRITLVLHSAWERIGGEAKRGASAVFFAATSAQLAKSMSDAWDVMHGRLWAALPEHEALHALTRAALASCAGYIPPEARRRGRPTAGAKTAMTARKAELLAFAAWLNTQEAADAASEWGATESLEAWQAALPRLVREPGTKPNKVFRRGHRGETYALTPARTLAFLYLLLERLPGETTDAPPCVARLLRAIHKDEATKGGRAWDISDRVIRREEQEFLTGARRQLLQEVADARIAYEYAGGMMQDKRIHPDQRDEETYAAWRGTQGWVCEKSMQATQLARRRLLQEDTDA